MKKKLLQINTVVNTTSTGRIAEDIGRLAIKNGWDSYIAFGRNEQISNSTKFKIGNKYDIIWHGIETRLFDRHGFASRNATKNLIKEIDNLQPDIIHLHNLHGYYINIELLFKYLSSINVPVIWTFHDCWPITGHCTYFSYVNCNKWKSLCHNCPQKIEYPESILCDRSTNNYLLKKSLFNSVKDLTIITVSNWLQNIIYESFLKQFPVSVINNGVDTNIFRPEDAEDLRKKYKLEKSFVILGVANKWERRKGFDDFLALSKLLALDEIIILVGVKEQVIKMLPKNIIGIKRTESIKELAQLYSLADIFFNPTWEDNFPTTNIEALSCGTPVITYNTGGSPEAVSPETGFVTEQGNLTQVRAYLDIIKRKSKKSFTSFCRNSALTSFNKELKFLEYIQLYNTKL